MGNPLDIKGKILWTGKVKVVKISSEDLKKLGYSDEEIIEMMTLED